MKNVSGNKVIDFTLAPKVDSLDRVVIVGYGSSPKSVPSANPATTTHPATQSVPRSGFTMVEQVPEFPGGKDALGQYLARNLRYPSEARQNNTQGIVLVQFTVDKSGSIQDLRVKKSIGSGCDEEAVRVVSQMPPWKPGLQNDRPVRTQYVLPIQFQLEGKEDKRSGQVIQDHSSPATILNDRTNTAVSISGGNMLSTDPATKPLFVVDGKKLASTENLATTIGPNSIASINVLKGTSATSIYGNEGQNGVVEVTSKQKAMAETIRQSSRPDTDSTPMVYVLDDKVITREEFEKLDPRRIESVEVDHAKPSFTIKATSKK